MSRLIAAFAVSLTVGLCVGPGLIFLLKKLKARQNILCYVEQHKSKQGVPTMGGLLFIFSAAVGFFLFSRGQRSLAVLSFVVFLTYGLVGLLDDGIKVILKRNLGLKAYQKIISQAVIAVLTSYYCYSSPLVGSAIYLPYFHTYAELSWWYLPLCFLLFIATTNAVNLTDGLDGLAGNVSAIYLFFIGLFLYIEYKNRLDLGRTFEGEEIQNLLILCAAVLGGITAFLCFNTSKASVFMGDTGSLALGGICCVLPVMIKNPILIAFVGIMFVVSVISVIVQVASFKLKKKRVLLMAPLHHHLEMKGLSEPKIVTAYSVVTVFFGLLMLLVQ
ncbi:MAG: phospho-N-acetylmuramoyl-pentapeptide-transferase [Clostridia bacterium]|nr:phospho-N-acetylmuramoyl-pentapeptide-transferase [Clostridia bacterium]